MKEAGHITDFPFKGKSDHLYLYRVIAIQVIDFCILKGHILNHIHVQEGMVPTWGTVWCLTAWHIDPHYCSLCVYC